MQKNYMMILPMLVLLFTAVLSLGQTANNTSATEDNATALDNTGPNLNYIWSISGIESGLINMVLNQDGQDLYGQAKYEPEGDKAWNADVIGSITDGNVELVLTASKDKVTTTTKMKGFFANESIAGDFTQISVGKVVNKGNFSAQWISPDTESYTPAIIEEPKVETPEPEPVVETIAENTSEDQPAKSRFVDVRQYADKIGPGGDLSGVPPGMGGSGLN